MGFSQKCDSLQHASIQTVYLYMQTFIAQMIYTKYCLLSTVAAVVVIAARAVFSLVVFVFAPVVFPAKKV